MLAPQGSMSSPSLHLQVLSFNCPCWLTHPQLRFSQQTIALQRPFLWPASFVHWKEYYILYLFLLLLWHMNDLFKTILERTWSRVFSCICFVLYEANSKIYRCPRRNGQNFGRVFHMLNYTDITQNTYIQSWTVTEIMAIEKCGLLGCPRTVRRPWSHTNSNFPSSRISSVNSLKCYQREKCSEQKLQRETKQ